MAQGLRDNDIRHVCAVSEYHVRRLSDDLQTAPMASATEQHEQKRHRGGTPGVWSLCYRPVARLEAAQFATEWVLAGLPFTADPNPARPLSSLSGLPVLELGRRAAAAARALGLPGVASARTCRRAEPGAVPDVRAVLRPSRTGESGPGARGLPLLPQAAQADLCVRRRAPRAGNRTKTPVSSTSGPAGHWVILGHESDGGCDA